MATVKRIVTDPTIFMAQCDDFAPEPDKYEPAADAAIYVLVKDERGIALGVWTLVPRTRIKYEVHTSLLPSLRGFRALDAAARMSEWIWQNTPCEFLCTEVPTSNLAALWFAKAARMVQYGIEPRSYRKGGILQDVVLLGMNRPEVEKFQ